MPDVKSYDLSFYAEQAIQTFGGLSRMTSLDSVLLSVMEADVAQVLHELCTTLDNLWFPAHLLDLVYHAEPTTSASNSSEQNSRNLAENGVSNGSLREYLLLEYATCLMSHKSLWQCGVLYLDSCPTQGRQRWVVC